MKKTKSHILLEKLIAQAATGDEHWHKSLLELKRACDKDGERHNFKIERISKDRKIAVNLLDQTIEDLKEKLRELEIANEEMQHFMHVASHDLKTPLRSIGSFASLIRRRYSEAIPAEALEYFSYIQQNAKAMNNVIEDLVSFNNVAKNINHSQFSLDELLTEVKRFLFADIQESGASVEFSELGEVHSGETALGQVFQNLIRNAIVYRDLSRPCRIHISAKRKGDVCTIAVADNGSGLDESFKDKVFKPFKRVGNLEREGTGMGLAIARKIVQKLGGEIDYRGKEGVGTTFYIGIGGPPQTDFAFDERAGAVSHA